MLKKMEQNKKNNVSIYVSDEEKATFEKACSLAGISKSSFIKSSALKDARRIIKELGEVGNSSD